MATQNVNIENEVGRFHSFLQATKALRVIGGIALLSSRTSALDGVGVSPKLRPPLPPGKTCFQFYRRLGGNQVRPGRGGKSRPHRDSIPDRPALSSVAILTELPGPLKIKFLKQIAKQTLKTISSFTNSLLVVKELCSKCL